MVITIDAAEWSLLPTRDGARGTGDVQDAPCWYLPRLRGTSLAKRTVQAVDGDQLLSAGTSGISSPLCPLFVRQIALPGQGTGLTYRASELIHPGERSLKAQGLVFFCRSQGADSLRYVKSSSRRGVPAAVM